MSYQSFFLSIQSKIIIIIILIPFKFNLTDLFIYYETLWLLMVETLISINQFIHKIININLT